MKTRIRNRNSAEEEQPIEAPHGVPATIEEIRQRAYKIAMAPGGEPGKEFDDWHQYRCRTTQDGHDMETDHTSEKESSVSADTTRIRALAIVGAVSLVIFVSGCASVPASADAGTFKYNYDADYRPLRFADQL